MFIKKDATWQEFKDSGAWDAANALLHRMGWTIVLEISGDKIVSAHPQSFPYVRKMDIEIVEKTLAAMKANECQYEVVPKKAGD